MKAKRLALGMAALALSVGLGAAASAGGFGPHGGGRHGHDGPGFMLGKRMLSQLELSDAQTEQLRAMWEKRHEQMRPAHQSLMEANRTLREAIHAKDLNESAIRAAAAEVARIEADLAVERARGLAEMRALLTPEQLTKLEELKQKAKERMKEHWQERQELRKDRPTPGASADSL